MMRTPKRKLKPSWEIYNRILWDPKLNQLAFYIGYEDRMIKHTFGEKLLVDWADNDIPWNRVQYIRCGDIIVWDRAKRLDLFEDNKLPSEAFVVKNNLIKNTIVIEGISIVRKPVFCIDNGSSAPVLETPNYHLETLKVLSFNLLTDKYSPNLVKTSQRIPAILTYLLEMDADVLLLQEVDAPMLKELLQTDWGTPLYSSDLKRQTDNYYQELVILSKYPFSIMEYQYSSKKKFPIASWQINGQPIHIANVHLSSNRAEDATAIREEQLHILIKYLHKLQGTLLIGGDFNTRDEQGNKWLNTFNFIDAWTELHPNNKGYTFDPDNNPLAQQSTLTGLPARFDRIYLNSKNRDWEISKAEIFANKSLVDNSQLFPSDHYGLAVSIKKRVTPDKVESKSTSNWNKIYSTYHSAIVLIPNETVKGTIQKIRQQFDRKHQRWMPHITLLYGFLPDRYFEKAAKELSPILKKINPFLLTLKQYQFFNQKSETTAWLEPSEQGDNKILQQLQTQLQQLFSMKNMRQESKHVFTPHMSIGQFKSIEEALASLPDWQATSFEVTKLAFISRHNQEPFKVRYTIELGTGLIKTGEQSKMLETELIQFIEQKKVLTTKEQQATSKIVLELIAAACSSVLNETINLYPLGSTALGTNLANSDVDVLCAIPAHLEILPFLKRVMLELQGYCEEARLVHGAKVPVLKLKVEEILVDLLCVAYPSTFISMESLSIKHRRYFAPQSWQAVSGILEVQSISAQINGRLSIDSFQWFVKIIKYWSIQRCIKGNAWGFLSSYSWTILAAWVIQQIPDNEEVEDLMVLITYFFDVLVSYNWAIPLSLIDEHNYKSRGKQDRMAILTSVKPYYNSARNVTQSTAKLLKKEFKRGQEIMGKLSHGKANWEDLLEKVTLPSSPNLTLIVSSSTAEELQEACGWLEGHIVGLIISLEQLEQLIVRPYPSIKRDKKTVWFYIDLQGIKKELFPVIKSCIATFIHSFEFDNQASELSYKLH